MRIAVIGAGAIGGWLGVRLADAGNQVSVLARGSTLQSIRARGWQLRSGERVVTADVRASDDAADLGEQDLVILALKAPALPLVAPALRPLLGANTTVLPAMNGVPWWFMLGQRSSAADLPLHSVDPGGAIAAAIPLASVLGCVVHAAATSARPGMASLVAGNRLIIGEADGTASKRAAAVADILVEAGFDVTQSARIRRDIWYKLWGNMTMNPISAFTGAACDAILDDAMVRRFVLGCMAEAQDIGARIGCPIEERGEDRILVTRKLGAFKTSMLQDVENGRPLEIDALLAAPREIALSVGVATPNIDALLGMTRLFARTRGLYPA